MLNALEWLGPSSSSFRKGYLNKKGEKGRGRKPPTERIRWPSFVFGSNSMERPTGT